MAREPAAEAGSSLDTDSIGVGSCWGTGAGKAWRQQRRSDWQ